MEDPLKAVDGDGDMNSDSQGTLPSTLELVGSSEVDTQPIEEKEEPVTDHHWGTLIPNIKNLDCIKLHKTDFLFGRKERCHVVINEHHLPVTEDENIKIDKVSRIMFRIFRTRNAIGLEDLSKNGTFVNSLKVGNNNKQPLRDGDTIGILDESFVIYTFISENGPRAVFPSALCDGYLMGSAVGDGSTSVVHEAWRRDDIRKVAVKIINKIKWPTKYSAPSDLMKEVNILKDLDHPGIIKVLDLIETPITVNIVMEYAEGGELFDQIQEDLTNEALDESVAKFQFYQICTTIEYLHRKNVCHRDLKLENLLLDRKDRKGRIKVTDFGLSKESSEKSILETYVGTPIYIAPEIISSAKTGKSYDLKSDCWSLGVILYTLLSATPPFNQDLEEKFLNKLILSGKYCKMKGKSWDKVSQEGKDLVASLLTVDPKERPSASEILDHKWFSNDELLCDEAREVLFSKTGNNAAELYVSVKTISNNLEGLSVGQEGTGDKRAERKEGTGDKRPERKEGSGVERPERKEGTRDKRAERKEGTGDKRAERKEGSGVKRAEPCSTDSHEMNGNKRPRVEVDQEVFLVEDSLISTQGSTCKE